MAEASKMEQKKEEKQKMGYLGEKLEAVTKRDERDKGGSWNGSCKKKITII